MGPWWRGAVIYQIYPRSFLDTNGDGCGDLEGIRRHLAYVQELGVDAIWISPFFRSPMKDFGYDVSDYRDVDPLFGTMPMFDALLDEAHRRGLKVLIDLVLNHTSDQHPWFSESRQSRNNPKADWYVWADPKPDGSPPNNWLSIFGGVAWEWCVRRRQYYLHNFLSSQPDLNFYHPEVCDELLDVTRFWLERGVDGFRLDTVNFYFHDRELRDNPPARSEETTDGTTRENPYSYQEHVYDKSRPENFAFLKRLRRLIDSYPDRFTIGEIGASDSLAMAASYVRGGDHLHTAYTFNLLSSRFSAGHIRATLERMESLIDDGWPCWSFGNHDTARVVTRWGEGNDPDRMARLTMAMLGTLRGTICIYQGEELGLTEAQVPFERLRDPYGINFWPLFKGRDGCRTPLPWSEKLPFAGFSTVEPWLPIPEEHRSRAVDRQDRDPCSVLAGTRELLRRRREEPALVRGSLEFLDVPEPVLAFERALGERRILCAFNLGPERVRFAASGAEHELAGLDYLLLTVR